MLELLNQLDRFEVIKNIKVGLVFAGVWLFLVTLQVIMATNRPGRIDRKIEFPPPNEEARLDILKIHSLMMNLIR